MATIKVVSVMARAQIIWKDETGVRGPVIELQDWLNDSYREIVTLHPDANEQIDTFSCTAGYRQTLDTSYPNAYKILEVLRNVAATSNKKYVQLVTRSSMDKMRPNWANETPNVSIQKYMYDKRVPKDFLVYPPATMASQLEIIYATVPSPHMLTQEELEDPTTVEEIRLDDIYASPILDYILYRAFSKDAEDTSNAARAVAHYQAMTTSLNFKVQSDESVAPGSS